MSPTHRHVRMIVVAIVLAAPAACAGDDAESTPAGDTAVPGSNPAAGAFSDADVEFAQGMIPHHEQAIEMSEIALDPTTGAAPAIVDLATRIQAAQDPEIELMRGWLTAWAQPLQMETSDGHDMSSMEGMMSADELDALAVMTGAEFDARWLEMMIEHHRGAIAMAEDVGNASGNADVLALAAEIIAAQQAEIAEMVSLLG